MILSPASPSLRIVQPVPSRSRRTNTLPSATVLRVKSKKASARSILAWVAHCDPTLRRLRLLPTADNAAEPGELAALAASVFARDVLQAARAHGLARAYARQPVSASVMRGRIDFSRQARARGDRAAIACIVWERTQDILLNRWLASAVLAIVSDPVMRAACANEIPSLRALFDGIEPLTRAELHAPPPRLPRHLAHLEMPVALASLLIRQSYLDQGVSHRGTSFFINLEPLFELTVVRAFKDAGVACTPRYSAHYQMEGTGRTTEALEIDLFCSSVHGGLVVDAKYKTELSAANLHQMVTYCHLTGATTAVLVLPAGHLRGPRRYTFGAPDGKKIIVETAELRTDAQRIEDWRVFGRALVDTILALAKGRVSR